MVFSSTTFLFLFLPLVLFCYVIFGAKSRNIVLLVASLFFYAWGESFFLLLMLVSICCNYCFGLLIDKNRGNDKQKKAVLIFAITTNLGLLGFFKYSNFLVKNLNIILQNLSFSPIELAPVHLPIGISFFTFQALSYVVDVYRNDSPVQKNFINIALYISIFPQLIAGPIVRYHDVAKQITERHVSLRDFSAGTQRFILGLGKKVLIANTLGRTADYLFSLPPDQLSFYLAWLGAIAYTLQIYYDFSGYSDMAIGLGRMFGFRFMENFNYPYISKSIREFWRRWHISLSSWFRDYLYIPLGGNRKGAFRTYLHLLTVFFLCGLWHGASWTFVVWGLYHGTFLILERVSYGARILRAIPSFIRYCYVLVVVIVGWVIFRAETFSHAVGYLKAMTSFSTPSLFNSQIFININNEFYLTFIIAVLFSMPIYPSFRQLTVYGDASPVQLNLKSLLLSAVNYCLLGFILFYSIASIMRGSYNPFLYFRF